MFLVLKLRNFSSRDRIKKMECFNLKEYTGSNKSITGKKFVKLTLSVSSLCYVFSHMYCSRDISITLYRMTSTRGNVFTTWNRNILIWSFFYITGREGCQRRSWSNGTTRTYFPLKIRFVG